MFLSNQEKKQCSPMSALWVEILSEWVFHIYAFVFSREIKKTFT